MARWTRLLDRADWDQIHNLFHSDARDEHGLFGGSVAEIRTWLEERAPAIEQSFHQIGQVIIDFVGEDAAIVETYVTAWFRYRASAERLAAEYLSDELASGGRAVNVVMPGRYIDRVERRAGIWRIARRRTVYEAGKAWAENESVVFGPSFTVARRDKCDALYSA